MDLIDTTKKAIGLGLKFNGDSNWFAIENFLFEKFGVWICLTRNAIEGGGWFSQPAILGDRDRRALFMDKMGWEEIDRNGIWTKKEGYSAYSESPVLAKAQALEMAIEVLYEDRLKNISQNN